MSSSLFLVIQQILRAIALVFFMLWHIVLPGFAPPQPVAPVVPTHPPVIHRPVSPLPPVFHPPPPPIRPVPQPSVPNLIRQVFGRFAPAALAVARCESGYNPSAYNPASGASGLFQFLYGTWLGTPYRGYSRFDAWANANAAYYVFRRDGYSWREWQCQP